MNRLAAIGFLVLLAGCASGYDIRPPATPEEWAETNAQLAKFDAERLYTSNSQLCADLGDRCAIRMTIGPSDGRKKAGTDGNKISINLPMARFLQNDHERALLMAHEWAHNLLGHMASFDGYRTAVEMQADCVGAALMIRAGYDLRTGAEFIRRAGSDYRDTSERHDRLMKTTFRQPITRESIRATCGVAP